MGGVIRVNERFKLLYIKSKRDHAVRSFMLNSVCQYLAETKATRIRYKLQEYIHLSPLQQPVKFVC